ncbi:MAG: MinD/ParA family protein [Planctomycetota bacterium]|nr:MAG: MinD/ParA family protein [Planctomycetota bacterium]
MTRAPARHATPREDQATRLRELVARLDRARDARPQPARASAGPADTAPVRSAHVIAIASGKGGVGKSNIAVNLCAALARQNVRVILFDGDDGLANADVLCGLHPRRRTTDEPDAWPPSLVEAPGGFRLAPGDSAGLAQRPGRLAQRLALVNRLASTEIGVEALVIDCGAGLGERVLAFTRAADRALIVSTPEPTALADAYALIKRLRTDTSSCGEAPGSIQLVVNQASEESDARRAHARLDAVSRRFLGEGVDLAGWIPLDPVVAECVRAQRPWVVARPRADASRAVRRLASGLADGFRAPARRRHARWRRWFGLRGR